MVTLSRVDRRGVFCGVLRIGRVRTAVDRIGVPSIVVGLRVAAGHADRNEEECQEERGRAHARRSLIGWSTLSTRHARCSDFKHSGSPCLVVTDIVQARTSHEGPRLLQRKPHLRLSLNWAP